MARGLFTDLYEIRMVESYLREDMTAPATFSLYIRPTPGRPWFVALGVQRVVELMQELAFDGADLAYLRGLGVSAAALDWLEALEPSGEVWGVPDGAVVLAEEPLVEVTAPLPLAQLVETAVINLVQLPTLVATKAARIALAARGRPVVDFGFRRAHGLETGVEAALAAWVGGGLSTSNLEAGRRFGLPVSGTMAHSYVQAHPGGELAAFRAFAAAHPDDTVLLVDTYDTAAGVDHAITVAGELRAAGGRLRGIRIDSGDLVELSRRARAALDEAGHEDVAIVASGGLNEMRITELVAAGAPIDAFGVGTDLVVSMDRPAVDIAYKLVDYDGRPVVKRSPGKATLGGAKQVFRSGSPAEDVLGLREEDLPGRRLLRPVWRDGEPLVRFDTDRARELAAAAVEGLPEAWKAPGARLAPVRPTRSAALRELADQTGAG